MYCSVYPLLVKNIVNILLKGQAFIRDRNNYIIPKHLSLLSEVASYPIKLKVL